MPETRPHAVNELEDTTAVIIVDHGSRRAKSNEMLLELVHLYQQETGQRIVEPAHMELAEPTIATAWRRCAEQGARTIVLHPYFLLPGNHWAEDIPRLAAQAAEDYPEMHYLVTAPLGLHPGMTGVIRDRVRYCQQHARGEVPACDVCQREPQGACAWRHHPASSK